MAIFHSGPKTKKNGVLWIYSALTLLARMSSLCAGWRHTRLMHSLAADWYPGERANRWALQCQLMSRSDDRVAQCLIYEWERALIRGDSPRSRLYLRSATEAWCLAAELHGNWWERVIGVQETVHRGWRSCRCVLPQWDALLDLHPMRQHQTLTLRQKPSGQDKKKKHHLIPGL